MIASAGEARARALNVGAPGAAFGKLIGPFLR